MTCRVLLFAALRELAGSESVTLEMTPDGTIADLRRLIALNYPTLATLTNRSQVAVNYEFAENERIIRSTDELAIIPPVSGG